MSALLTGPSGVSGHGRAGRSVCDVHNCPVWGLIHICSGDSRLTNLHTSTLVMAYAAVACMPLVTIPVKFSPLAAPLIGKRAVV